ncbi:tRNA-dihydrouridine synthase [Fasciola hepatica]|uniref:tRNA-dihydrouridine synthase n=1 Tax=Fasciola hepatica TaxID=6192 RepID=A0A4E0R3Z8_FASHE|nr:tRNA-dihydrouridine synthase [Fasciola hepatica]
MDILSTYQQPDLPFVRISAPMVRYTKLPFRLLVRQYGVDVAYTPMIMADSFITSAKARDVEFTTCTDDRPLIVQFASEDPCELAKATELVADYCDGVDLNCGCPQKWALQRGLGSALLRHPEKMGELIRVARNTVPRWRDRTKTTNLTGAREESQTDTVRRAMGPFSVTVKIRIAAPGIRACGENTNNTTINATVEICRRLALMGADWITLHARTPEQRSSEPAEWDLVRELIEIGIRHRTTGGYLPVVLNGDVESLDDAMRAHAKTKCHGVMAARALLTNPRLFSSDNHDAHVGLRNMICRWLEISAQHPGGTSFRTIHQHAYWMMESHLDRSRRMLLHSVNSFSGMIDWLEEYWPPDGISKPSDLF